jgi:hypothetical protein
MLNFSFDTILGHLSRLVLSLPLKATEVIWEGDWEVVKRSGRDESTQVAIHMCMEAMLGISA